MASELVACACCGWVEERTRLEFICTFCGLGQVCIPSEQYVQSERRETRGRSSGIPVGAAAPGFEQPR